MKTIMKLSFVFPMALLTGCSAWIPELSNIIDSIEDTAVCVEVNKDALSPETDVHVKVDVINKDPPKAKVVDTQKS